MTQGYLGRLASRAVPSAGRIAPPRLAVRMAPTVGFDEVTAFAIASAEASVRLRPQRAKSAEPATPLTGAGRAIDRAIEHTADRDDDGADRPNRSARKDYAERVAPSPSTIGGAPASAQLIGPLRPPTREPARDAIREVGGSGVSVIEPARSRAPRVPPPAPAAASVVSLPSILPRTRPAPDFVFAAPRLVHDQRAPEAADTSPPVVARPRLDALADALATAARWTSSDDRPPPAPITPPPPRIERHAEAIERSPSPPITPAAVPTHDVHIGSVEVVITAPLKQPAVSPPRRAAPTVVTSRLTHELTSVFGLRQS